MSTRSRTGCSTCRTRKLKCDENFTQGTCQNCSRSNRTCSGAVGAVFRNQQNPSLNRQGTSTLNSFYAYRNTFDDDSVWVKIPAEVQFIAVDPTIEDDELEYVRERPEMISYPSSSSFEPTQSENRGSHGFQDGPETLAAHEADQSDVSHLTPNFSSGLEEFQARNGANTRSASVPISFAQANTPHSLVVNPSLATILNGGPASITNTIQDRQLLNIAASGHKSLYHSVNVVTDHELAFLLRQFSEVTGYWMDLFDIGRFFSYHLLPRTITTPLLKYAAAALAAKHLGLVKGEKVVVGGICSSRASTEIYPSISQSSWFYKGAQLYDKAVSLLVAGIAEEQERDSDETDSHDTPRTYTEPDIGTPDDLGVATAILCAYEFIGASQIAYSRHIDGTRSLFDISANRMLRLQQSTTESLRPTMSRARRATFWVTARHDLKYSFVNETQTKLDPENLPLWRDVGLRIDGDGLLESSNTTPRGYHEGESIMKEDMIGNALIWLLMKLVNFGVAADSAPVVGEHQSWEGNNQATLQQRWQEVKHQFDVWYSGLPRTYIPTAIMQPTDRCEGSLGFGTQVPETWYSIPMVASTMQSFHMAQIILLINRPQHSTFVHTTAFHRLSSYKATASEIERHALAICSISLSRPDASVRINSLQPLWYAGQCLEGVAERNMILRLLRELEADTGWSTSGRVTQLMQLWGWDGD